jgi:hypothetical protein
MMPWGMIVMLVISNKRNRLRNRLQIIDIERFTALAGAADLFGQHPEGRT